MSFEQGEIGPDLFRAACNMGLEDCSITPAWPDSLRELFFFALLIGAEGDVERC
jgi:hypothetical protein